MKPGTPAFWVIAWAAATNSSLFVGGFSGSRPAFVNRSLFQ